MPRLFTKSDLERAARLAATAALLHGGDPEAHCSDAVAIVSREAPEYYDEHTIRDVLGEEALRKLYLVSVDNRAKRD